ncbi:MAG: hypothetical protein AAF211_29480 [Myxococcota bacterium]
MILPLLLGCVMRPGDFPTCESDPTLVELDHTPTFSDDIGPLIGEHCAGCHYEGGSAPFALLSYADAAPLRSGDEVRGRDPSHASRGAHKLW